MNETAAEIKQKLIRNLEDKFDDLCDLRQDARRRIESDTRAIERHTKQIEDIKGEIAKLTGDES